MIDRDVRVLIGAVALVLLGVLLFFYGLGDRDLTSSHEAPRGQNAQSILHEGDWLVPRLFDRHLELQKPPLYYWLVALCAAWRGVEVDAWSVRFPSALSALGCVLFLYLVGWLRGRPLAGAVAAVVLATSLHFTWLARIGRIDMPLTFAVTVTLGSLHLGRHSSGRLARFFWCWTGYTALGAGILLKGPIAVVLTGAIAPACHLPTWHRYFRSRFKAQASASGGRQPPDSDANQNQGADAPRSPGWRTWWWGLPWVVCLVAPWFIWANDRTENQIWEVFVWYHNIERGLGGSATLASYPVWYYLPRAVVDLLPWSLVLPIAVAWWWRTPETRGDPDARAGLLWSLAVLVFLSAMSFKRADYLLPAYPGIAIFLGTCAEHFWLRRRQAAPGPIAMRRDPYGWAFAAMILAYAGLWSAYNTWTVPSREGDWPYQRIARAVRSQTDMPVIFFRAESHVLAFHLGPPLDTILEWENLEVWANREFPVYFVMPADCAREWARHVQHGQLLEVFGTTDFHSEPGDRALVVMRSPGQASASR